jgi:hypothetical protein
MSHGETSFKGGLELKFFAHDEFESVENVSSEERSILLARNALRFLMMGWPSSWSELISWPVFKAVFIQRDPDLLRAMRLAFQEGFHNIYLQLRDLNLNSSQKEQVQLYLSNCLSLLPYSDLTPYESMAIPQYVDNAWVLVDYSIQPIELVPDLWLKRYFAKDKDRVFAYGLEPINSPGAQPHLIFMGTTYPAGQGFISQIHTDFEGFDTAGNSLYRNSRKRITDWLEKQKNKTHVCGVSLGGSLSLLLAIDQGHYLSRVDVLNPPGLHDPWGQNKYDRWDTLTSKPQVVVQTQASDPVSIFGVWKSDWDIIRVTPPTNKQGPNAFFDHFLNYAGFADTEFTYLVAAEENLKRKQRNFWLFTLGRNLIYYTVIAPYSFLVRPTFLAVNHYLQSKLIALTSFAVLSALLILVPLGLIAPIYLIASAALVTLACVANILLWPWIARYVNPNQAEGRGDEAGHEHAKLHDPNLKRNEQLDLYNPTNTVECEFMASEIHTYYKVMRCILKNKPFIPEEERPSKHKAGVSKKSLLLASEDPMSASLIIPLKVTKAKAIHIKNTVRLVEEIGIENTSPLKTALEAEYSHYCYGKR